MLKNSLLLILAFLLSSAIVSAQTQPPSAQNAAVTERALTDNTTRSNPFSIHIDETPTDSAKAASAQELPISSPVVADAPTEFQSFVESSVGKRLPIFGYNLFQGVPSTFAPLDRIAVPANYVIGPGDQLLIRAWGQIDVDASVTVDRNGQIYLPKLGLFRSPALAMNSYQTTSRMP